MFVDQSFTGASALGNITINSGGILYFPDNQALTQVDTAGILVNSGGILRVGTTVCPTGNNGITDQVILNFTGAPPQPTIPKGITVMSGGTLTMFGEKGTPLNQYAPDLSWSYLAAPAGPVIAGAKAPAASASTIKVAGQLDWQTNDWIVVASTDFDPDAGEFVQIASAPTYDSTSKTTTISLKQSLVNYHFGGLAPDDTLSNPNCKNGDGDQVRASYCEGVDHNFGVDERAEVGLITRSIKLTSTQTDLPFWQPGNSYSTGAIIQGQSFNTAVSPPVVTTYQFKATTGGTSGLGGPPAFPFPTDATISDGTVTWTNLGAVDLHWGGEINIAGGAITQIEGVEIENFGKDSHFSSPITITGSTTLPSTSTPDGDIAFNSIHHSYNHGIVLLTSAAGNSPKNLKINGNVIARATGHLYDLADGTATGIAFTNNLGAGGMEYFFGTCNGANANGACVGLTAAQFAARQMFWLGDNLAPVNHYDGYNIPLTDPLSAQPNPGAWAFAPVSGFYVTNISTSLAGNSIAGCEGNGNGVLYMPAIPVQTGPVAQFLNNRVHGCYVGLDASYGLSPGYSGNLNNIQPKDSSNLDQLTTFDGLTATRNRYFGTWMRPNYFVVNNARFATNRESVSLVSGGGPESSPAGEWGLLENSVAIGESQNNPNRFGPCPVTQNQAPAAPWGNDGLHGCNGDDFAGRGYPQPYWNEYGYMFYDGPARLDSDRFVNFLQDVAGIGTTASAIATCTSPKVSFPGLLTNADATFLCNYSLGAAIPGNNAANSTGKAAQFVYEGDAAFGWFQSNINNYPPTQYSEHMIFENVDLRHQVYTQEVNQGPFVDGDKGTVILDRDGTLTGYYVVDSAGNKVLNKFPISLNNLPFLGTPDSVDECHAAGPQDIVFEGRATSLISPQDYATLEINALTAPIGMVNCPATPGNSPNNNCPCVSWAGNPPTQNGNYNAANCNQFYFTKDQKDYPGVQQYDIDGLGPATLNNPFNPNGMELVPCAPDHSCISLAGRNQTGSYEPKVINGLGYTMQSIKGFPSFMDLGLVDAAAANGISQRAVSDASISNGQNMLSSASANFLAGDIGSQVLVAGAGSEPNGDLAATITSVSSGVAMLSVNANTTVSAAHAVITHPFGVRLGICYKTKSGTTPTSASDFTVKLGKKSWSNTGGNLPLMAPFLYMQIPDCQGIDFSSPQNLMGCPAAPVQGGVQTLTGISINSPSQLPSTLDPNAFYYDTAAGLLFLSVQQTEENAIGSSPLGTPGCNGTADAPCPDPTDGESFYSCPSDGCGLYTIAVNGNYSPNGPTVCTPYGAGADYSLPYPSNLNQLGYLTGSHANQSVQPFVMQNNGMTFETIFSNPATQQFAHNLDSNENGDCTFK